MNKALEQLISRHYPMLNRDCYQGTDFGYGGFEIPDGWFPLIVQFAKALDEIKPSNLVLYQIKEKFNHLIICAECSGSEKDRLALDTLEEHLEECSLYLCGRCGESLNTSHACHPRSQNEEALIEWAALYLEDATKTD